ncbi:MAG TPA: hypothetical protein VIV27_03765 [Halioglobus sp.]
MIRTLFLLGPSDRDAQNPITRSREKGGVRITADLAGILPILPYVMSDRTLQTHCAQLLVGMQSIRLPGNAPVNLFNLVGDADSSGDMLQKIQHIANEIRPRRFFNQPSRVFGTSRGRLPKTLANIPGCIVPRVDMVHPKTFGELQAVCEKFNAWPLIVRASGYHGGEHMLLLTEPAQLDSIKEVPWLYSGICLIEFIDYKNQDGLYQKSRVIMVDGNAYPRHSIFSDKWIIHAGSRVDLMHHDLELCRQEEHFIARLRDKDIGGYANVFREIHARIGLEVFGIDFSIVNGQIVIFEANACMQFLDRRFRDNSRYQYLESHVKNLERAIKKMLLQS